MRVVSGVRRDPAAGRSGWFLVVECHGAYLGVMYDEYL